MANYTEEQLNKITQMPAAVLLESMLADTGSAVVGMREYMAGEKCIMNASTMYPGNRLIQTMSRSIKLPKVEQMVQHVFSMGDQNTMRVECHQKISDGLAVLANDTEATQFKAFLAAIAEEVVNSAGEGFLGNRGDKISAKEAAYLQRFKQQLNITPPPSM